MFRLNQGWKAFLSFETKELRNFLITVIIAGFLLSSRHLAAAETLDSAVLYFVGFTLIFSILYFVFVASQKFIAATKGYHGRYEIWKYGPLLGFFLTMYSLMFFPSPVLFFLVILYLGNVSIIDVPRLRLGEHRRSINIKDMTIVGLTGPIVLLFLILFFIPFYALTGFSIIKWAIIFGSLILFFTSLPLPYMNGINVLIKSRIGWLIYFFFCAVFMFMISASLASWNVWIYISAVIIALLLAWWFKKYMVPKLH
ncbi:hypothetical protein K9L97_02290 [Candidatus Woesearchaeota archaeon]|nr:hypothetical protein [Candidatus Woesearchaeota archaeon]